MKVTVSLITNNMFKRSSDHSLIIIIHVFLWKWDVINLYIIFGVQLIIPIDLLLIY